MKTGGVGDKKLENDRSRTLLPHYYLILNKLAKLPGEKSRTKRATPSAVIQLYLSLGQKPRAKRKLESPDSDVLQRPYWDFSSVSAGKQEPEVSPCSLQNPQSASSTQASQELVRKNKIIDGFNTIQYNTIQYNTTLLSLCREICFLARHLHNNIQYN